MNKIHTRAKDLKKNHPLIYQRIEQICVEQGKEFDKHCFINHMIDWTLTEEKYGIWNSVNNGVFGPWYTFWDKKE